MAARSRRHRRRHPAPRRRVVAASRAAARSACALIQRPRRRPTRRHSGSGTPVRWRYCGVQEYLVSSSDRCRVPSERSIVVGISTPGGPAEVHVDLGMVASLTVQAMRRSIGPDADDGEPASDARGRATAADDPRLARRTRHPRRSANRGPTRRDRLSSTRSAGSPDDEAADIAWRNASEIGGGTAVPRAHGASSR